MSKTFKSAFENSNYRLEVCKNAGAERISLWILGCGSDSATIAVAHKDIPALALSILEAAGFEDSSTGGHITGARIAVGDLKRHVKMQERATAEAEAQAKLEAEALDFYNTGCEVVGIKASDAFGDLKLNDKSVFLAVARRAREINKETPNA